MTDTSTPRSRHDVTRRGLLKVAAAAGGVILAADVVRLAGGMSVLAATATHKLSIGDATLTVLSDGIFTLPIGFVLASTPAETVSRLLGQNAVFSAETNVVVIAVGSERILVDTGAGGDFMPTLGRLTDKLEAAGIAADSITKVVFTHGHADHLWGVVDPFDGGSRFTKARHVMSRIERDYWMTSGIEDKVPPAMKAMAVGTVRRLKELGDRIEPVALDAEIATGVGLLDTRGHTPGHVAVLVRSGSNQALIAGDALTHAIVSFQHPEWRWGSDADPDVAIATRRRLLDMLAREKTALLGYHLAYPGVGRVEATGSAHRFIPG